MRGRCQRAGISHSFLTDWPDGAGLWHLCRTRFRMLTCGYGFRCTGRTGGTIPPTGKRVAIPYTLGLTYREGKCSSFRLIFDRAELMTQLGLMPA